MVMAMPSNSASITFTDGLTIPQIGFGVAGILPENTTKMVMAALNAGYRMIDNASIYKNEIEVGTALAAGDVPVSEIFITSKVWPTDYGFDNVISACWKSLAALQVNQLDLYLLHWPAPSLGLYTESWKALIELQKLGLVKSIGVSNFYPNQIDELIKATGVKPAVNQIELHPYYQRCAEKNFHISQEIATQCWSPLGRATCLNDPILVKMASRIGKTPAQIVLQWQLQNGNIVIPRSRNIERMKQNIDIFDFTLNDENIHLINTMDQGMGGRLGPDFDLKELPRNS